MKIIASFILAIVVAGFAGDAPYKPTPDRYVDIHHSKIDIRIDLDDSTVTGNVTHIMSSLRTDLYIIQLDCEDTEVRQVLINNNRPLEYSLNGPKLNIELDRTYGFDDTLTLSIDYQAKPKKVSILSVPIKGIQIRITRPGPRVKGWITTIGFPFGTIPMTGPLLRSF